MSAVQYFDMVPRILGEIPGTGKKVEYAIGRFGPYLKIEGIKKGVSIKFEHDFRTLSLEDVLSIIADKI